jgi:hypothetical protein
MAPRKRSSTKNNIPRTAVEQAIEVLKDLPEKPKEELSLGEAVEMGREPILEALKEKNYSHEEVAATLSEHGVEITPSSLRYYLTRGRKKKDDSTKASRTRSTRKTSRGRKSSAGARVTSSTTAKAEENGSAPVPEEVATLAVDIEEPTTDLSGTMRRSARSTSKGRGRTAAKRNTTATAKTKSSSGKSTGRGRSTSTRKSKKKSADEA